jgi:hypothetical protein
MLIVCVGEKEPPRASLTSYDSTSKTAVCVSANGFTRGRQPAINFNGPSLIC